MKRQAAKLVGPADLETNFLDLSKWRGVCPGISGKSLTRSSRLLIAHAARLLTKESEA